MTILHLMLEKCCEDACNISSDDHLKGGFRDVVSENALLLECDRRGVAEYPWRDSLTGVLRGVSMRADRCRL